MRQDANEWLRVSLIPGLPSAALRALLKAFGNPTAICSASRHSLARVVPEPVAAIVEAGAPPALMEATQRWLLCSNHNFVVIGDEHYPPLLLETPDPPTLLYVMGNIDLLRSPSIAVVGSRNATNQGTVDAQRFSSALSDAGFAIVSGLALGIDAAAHRGGLSGRSSSIAVLGTGLDRAYPAANRDLMREIAQYGAVISEFPLSTPPIGHNFPRRNRIISGLSSGVVVVEAAIRSGSLITARMALDQGRDVFAIPGSIHSPLSKGCNWLIQQGAKLIECPEDILVELGIGFSSHLSAQLGASSKPANSPVLIALGHSPASADVLAVRCELPTSNIFCELTRLELAGLVERLPGGVFRQVVTS